MLVKISLELQVQEFTLGINGAIDLPVGIYLFKVKKGNIRTLCEICSKLTIKKPQRRHRRRFGAFIVNFQKISHIALRFSLLTWNK